MLDVNGSNESFELVTEENNGDGSKKPGTEGRCSLTESQSLQIFLREKTCVIDLKMLEMCYTELRVLVGAANQSGYVTESV